MPPYGEDPHHEAERVACNIEREALRKEVERLRAALEKAATYLDELHDNMIENDVDMMIDKNQSPRSVADNLRAEVNGSR